MNAASSSARAVLGRQIEKIVTAHLADREVPDDDEEEVTDDRDLIEPVGRVATDVGDL